MGETVMRDELLADGKKFRSFIRNPEHSHLPEAVHDAIRRLKKINVGMIFDQTWPIMEIDQNIRMFQIGETYVYQWPIHTSGYKLQVTFAAQSIEVQSAYIFQKDDEREVILAPRLEKDGWRDIEIRTLPISEYPNTRPSLPRQKAE
jgi:hypothetical protein